DLVRLTDPEESGIYSVQADATNPAALREAGLQNVQTVIVAIGRNVEASILAAMICRELEIPTVIAKADNSLHADVLRKIGVDQVVFPEDDMCSRLARNLVTGVLIDSIEMSPDVSVMEMRVPKRFAGRSLRGLDLRRKYGVSVLAIKRGDRINVSPHPDDVMEEDD